MPNRNFSQYLSKYLSQFLPGIVAVAFAGCALVSGLAQDKPVPRGGDSLTTIFTYTNFSDLSGLTLNGNAQQDGAILLVGPPALENMGSVYYSNQVNVAQGFATIFTLQITPNSNSYTTADGMAFIIQNSGVNALGISSGHPGYAGIADSLAVEFDTFQNFQLADPNNNHIGVQSCGVARNSINHASSCNLGLQPNLPLTLADGNPHKVSINYMPGAGGAAGQLTVAVDNQFILSSTVNLSTLLSLNGNDAWVGFTAGSGAAFEYGTVKNWTFATVGTAGK
jgi:hypothetical protein